MTLQTRTNGWIRGLLLVVVCAAGLALALLLLPVSVEEPGYGLVDDAAELMAGAQRHAVDRHHAYLLDAFDIDYRVVTGRGFGDVNLAAVETFRALGENSRSRSGRGLLLLIDAEADLVRLEVGYPLEGTFPDAFVDYVERQQMVPFFAAGRVADGIVATTELIVARVQRDAEGLGTATEPWAASSGGAGAVNDARLGAGAPARPSAGPAVAPGNTPEATLAAYFEAMRAHNADAGLAIYTPATRRMLADHLVTPGQMDNQVQAYRDCAAQPAIVAPAGDRAVIRYPAPARGCAPFFFQRAGAGWQLDLTVMQRIMRFDLANRWRFPNGNEHAYGFAFADWEFDANGYPWASESSAARD